MQFTKVIHGIMTKSRLFPFFALLLVQEDHQAAFCGCSHLGSGQIITAAHCVTDLSPNANLFAIFGLDTVHDFLDSHHHEMFHVSNFSIHPSFSLSTMSHDVALLEIPPPYPSSFIALPNTLQELETLEAVTSPLTILGYGNTIPSGFAGYADFDIMTSQLHVANVHVVSSKDYPMQTDDTMILATGTPVFDPDNKNASFTTDTCQGDSGGPLFLLSSDSPTLVGLTSWGIGCGMPAFPGVYSRLSASWSWIQSNLKK